MRERRQQKSAVQRERMQRRRQLESRMARKKNLEASGREAKATLSKAKDNAWEILEKVIDVSLRINPSEFTSDQAVFVLGEIRGIVRDIDQARLILSVYESVEGDVSRLQDRVSELTKAEEEEE